MAWQAEQFNRCSTCGTFAWEWDDDAEPYHASLHRCFGCQRIDAKMAESQSRYRAEKYGMKIVLRRNQRGG